MIRVGRVVLSKFFSFGFINFFGGEIFGFLFTVVVRIVLDPVGVGVLLLYFEFGGGDFFLGLFGVFVVGHVINKIKRILTEFDFVRYSPERSTLF
jgi:hypothetical protein